MMKTNKMILTIFILSLITLIFTGCGGIPVTPDDEEVDQEYIVEEKYFNVDADQGGTFSLSDGTEVKIDPGDLSDDAYLVIKKINYDLELSKFWWNPDNIYIYTIDILDCKDLLNPVDLYMVSNQVEYLVGGIIRVKDDTFELVKEFINAEGGKVQVAIEEIGKCAYMFVTNPINDLLILNDLAADINRAVKFYYDENCTSLFSLYQQAQQEEDIAGDDLENYPGVTREDAEEIFAKVDSWGTIIDLGADLITTLAPNPVTATYSIYSTLIGLGEVCQYLNAYMIAENKADIYKSKIFKRRVIKYLYEQGCLEVDYEEDFIHIISVTPDSGLIDGADTNFTVVVEYNLVSCDTGTLIIFFNHWHEWDPSCLIGIDSASYSISKGSGTHEFNVTAVANNWEEYGDFSVVVMLELSTTNSAGIDAYMDGMSLSFL